VSKVTASNRMLADCHTRCRIDRWINNICVATLKWSDARNRHNVDCGGTAVLSECPSSSDRWR